MTVIDQIKTLDNKIKANQVRYDLGRDAAKISALSSENILEKYEYLTSEDLGTDQLYLKKLNLSILHWVRHLVKHLKKIRLKFLLRAKVILIITANMLFTDFYKGYNELKEVPLDSEYNKVKEFNKLLIVFKPI